jgi:NifU-like protein involved in Fe-S cluster formation
MAMDEAVRLIYRDLVRTGFRYSGKLDNPSIFLDTLEEGVRLCSSVTNGFMNIYLVVQDDVIKKARYLCSCDPTANVVVETMCILVEGKTLEQVENMQETDFYQAIGSRGESLVKRVQGMIELLHRGIKKYRSGNHPAA